MESWKGEIDWRKRSKGRERWEGRISVLEVEGNEES